MRIRMIIFTCAAAVFLAGCDGQDEGFTRYPSVSIPQYDMADYFKLLLSDRPEIVYNAVCNLQDHVSTVESALSNEKADKNSRDFILSRAILTQITYLVQSRDVNVASASIRFLHLYAKRGGPNEKLVRELLAVRSRNKNVLYERLAALFWAASPGSRIDDKFLRDSLRDPSWVVSRTTYLLINRLERDTFRRELIGRYRAARDETEKLLIFVALTNNFSDKEFAFLARELLSTKSRKIKKAIFNILENARDKEAVLAWLGTHYEKLSKDDIEDLAQTYSSWASSAFRVSLFRVLLKKGFVPKEDRMRSWADTVREYREKKTVPEKEKAFNDELVKLDQDLMANEALREAWRSQKEEDAAKTIDPQLQAEHDKAVDQFVAQMNTLLAKYNLNEEQKKEYLDALSSVKQYFADQFGK